MTGDAGMPRIVPYGERAYLIELGDSIDEALNARVHALAQRIEAMRASVRGLGRVVPAYASLLVPFDPALVDAAALRDELAAAASSVIAAPVEQAGATVEIPVRYGGAAGPDLDEVASRAGLTSGAVIELHRGTAYRVFMLGFAPGFAYLGTLPAGLRLPRRAEPRIRVPAGSVAVAGAQTAIYPHQTAGGWHLLGRTESVLWDGAAREPALLRPGDHVRFVPI